MPLSIVRNDITKLRVDAIVNATNGRLAEDGGVSAAIFKAAGENELRKACNKIGYCCVGDAVITKAFKLKAKYIIHTVGPVYGKDSANEEQQLYSCYEKSLKLALKKRVKTIAFPLISSGNYGYPKDEALRIATKAISDFLMEKDMKVFLVVYDKDSFSISEKLYSNVKSYIDEHLVLRDERFRKYLQYSMFEDSESVDESLPGFLASEPVAMPKERAVSPKAMQPKATLSETLKGKKETFSQMLFKLIDASEMTDVEVYKRANIDRKLFSKMRRKDYVPRKSTVFALIMSLKLEMKDAKELLARAGYAFNESNEFDLIVEYFIENGNYDIYEINETLFAFDQQILGS